MELQVFFFFFFQAEDGIRDIGVTGVQTCALPIFYTVKRGDTLALIAKKMHVSRTDLAEANYLRSTARVVAGDTLMVPQDVMAATARVEPSVPAKSRSRLAGPKQPSQTAASSDVRV